MNTTAEKYVKMVADTDAAVNFYMEMEGGRFFLTFLAEALMELLEAEELTSVTLLLRKFFEAAGSNTPECLSDDSTAFASAQCVELLSELLAEQFPADAEFSSLRREKVLYKRGECWYYDRARLARRALRARSAIG